MYKCKNVSSQCPINTQSTEKKKEEEDKDEEEEDKNDFVDEEDVVEVVGLVALVDVNSHHQSKNKHTRETATLSTSRPATTPTSAPKESSFGGSWVVSVVLMDLCWRLPFRFHNSWSWKLGILLPSVCWTAVSRVVRRGRSNSVSICPAICVTVAVCE